MGSPDTGPAVFHGLVGDGELAQVVADHVRPDFHLVEGLAVVDTHHAAHRLGQNDPVAQVRPHDLRLLPGRRVFLGLAQLLHSEGRFLRRPRFSRRRRRALHSCIGCSWDMSSSWSRSAPRWVSLRKVRCCSCSTSAILPVLQKAICKFFEVKVAILTCVR